MKKGLIALAVLLLLLVAVPLLIPTDDIRRQVEAYASQAAGAPVTIDALSLRLLPIPGASVKGVRLQDVQSGTPRLVVDSGVLSAAFMPLLAGKLELSGIRMQGIHLRTGDVARGEAVRTLSIDRVSGDVTLAHDTLDMRGWQARLYGGEVKLDAAMAPLEGERRSLTAHIRAAGVRLRPLLKEASGNERVDGSLACDLQLSVSGEDAAALQQSLQLKGSLALKQLTVEGLAEGGKAPPLRVDVLSGDVHGNGDRLSIDTLKAQMYQGTLDAAADVSPLAGEQRKLSGNIRASGIQVAPLLLALTGKRKLSGTLNGELGVESRGADGEAVMRNLRVRGPLRLANGTLYDVSLKGGASMLLPGGNSSGDIAYQRLTTSLAVNGRDVRADNLVLLSPSLDARGHVHVKADKQLEGEMQVTSTYGLTGAKLLVGGTMEHPVIFPSPSSMIGGAIGSTIAGPAGAAVGANIGGKIGSAVEGIGSGIGSMFGDKKKK